MVPIPFFIDRLGMNIIIIHGKIAICLRRGEHMNRNLIKLKDLTIDDVWSIFKIADEIQEGKYKEALKGKTVIMFFPASSIRTRVTFEKCIYLLGGQTILFDPSTLDKKEEIEDVIGYLNNWADAVVVRYPDISMLEQIALSAKMPVINAMTSINHPCEILADLYSLHKMGRDILKEKFLFVGAAGNIGYAWKEASVLLEFTFQQCSPNKYKMEGVTWHSVLSEAVKGKDIICTDSIPKEALIDFEGIQVTKDIMELANKNALLNPCPPFYRGEEVAADVIDSQYFVGYEFKKYLLEIQMAVMVFCLR